MYVCSEMHNREIYELIEDYKFLFVLQEGKHYSAKVSLQGKNIL